MAIVTGATQGLGYALAHGLASRLDVEDLVILTGRDEGRVLEAVDRVGATSARVEGRLLDVSENRSVSDFGRAVRAEFGTVDLVLSNAAARLTPGTDPVEEIDALVETNNLGTIRILNEFAPILEPGGRLIVIASSFGTLFHLPGSLGKRFDDAPSLQAIESLVEEWRRAVRSGTAESSGWPSWLNIPSKVAQVAAVRALARLRNDQDRRNNVLLAAACPGLIDTAASRPWFGEMDGAQSPATAALAILDLVLEPVPDDWYGELIQFGRVLPWSKIASEGTTDST